jgi:S-methylmethionine-dependent homocysteine/selenocysteine methylase
MIVLDGATGTELARRGVDTRGQLFSAQALLSDEGIAVLREVHRDYVRAGAQVITANTFRTNPRAAGARWRELTAQAVRMARESGAVVAGSIAPITDCYTPYELDSQAADMATEFILFAHALAEEGCDLLLVETVPDAFQGGLAATAAVATGKPVWVSVSVSPSGKLRDGSDLPSFFRSLRKLEHVSGVLINCTPCDGIDAALDAAAASKLPFGAYANMGDIDPATGWPSTPVLSPEEYAARAKRWLDRGATIVGGCCGTTPAHIEALAKISPERHDPCHPDRRLEK